MNEEMKESYDIKGGVRGKYYEQYKNYELQLLILNHWLIPPHDSPFDKWTGIDEGAGG